jgi:plasmid maintenance system antidote protein VapI
MSEELKALKLDYSCPPGDTLLEVLEERELAVSQVALDAGLSEQVIVRLLSGTEQLSPEIAAGLERGLGIPAQFWLNLESHWRSFLMRDADRVRRRKTA